MKSPEKRPETRAELKTQLEARFDRMDANHDGKIDAKDPEARRAEHIATLFERIDTDKNGAISKAEFAAAEDRRDGPPMMRGMAGPMRPGRAMLFHRGGMEGGRFRGPLPFTPPPSGPMRRGPSADGRDRKPGEALTKSDFVDRGLARFDRVDTDHDGKISPAERDAVRGPMRGFRGRAKLPPPPPTPSQSGQ